MSSSALVTAVFSVKGGVGKTSTVLELAHRLEGKTLVVDCDPQCNATGSLLNGKNSPGVLPAFYDQHKESNLSTCVLRMRQVGWLPTPFQVCRRGDLVSREEEEEDWEVEEGESKWEMKEGCIKKDLYLLGGHLGFGQSMVAIGLGALDSDDRGMHDFSWFYRLLRDLVARDGYDHVLLDMSPESNTFNMIVLLGADQVLVPVGRERTTFGLVAWTLLRADELFGRKCASAGLRGPVVTAVLHPAGSLPKDLEVNLSKLRFVGMCVQQPATVEIPMVPEFPAGSRCSYPSWVSTMGRLKDLVVSVDLESVRSYRRDYRRVCDCLMLVQGDDQAAVVNRARRLEECERQLPEILKMASQH